MKIKTSKLTGAALDWAVALACDQATFDSLRDPNFHPSTAWSQGGPIIEREKITIWDASGVGHDFAWGAYKTVNHNHRFHQRGDDGLTAAMRCFVASRLGDEVDVPKELLR